MGSWAAVYARWGDDEARCNNHTGQGGTPHQHGSTVELPGQDCSETISVRPIWDTELKSTNLEDVMS
jgi:hypothetical protein